MCTEVLQNEENIYILITLSLTASAVTTNAAPIPKESLPCYATTEQVTVTENLISGILDEVKNGLGEL